jgi:hypothetical protein
VRRICLAVGVAVLLVGCTAPSTRVTSDTSPGTRPALSAQPGGPHVSLTTSSATLTAAEIVDIGVHVTDSARGLITGWTLELGDGRIVDHGIPDGQVTCPPQSNISPRPDGTIDDLQTVRHAFRTGYCPPDWAAATADLTLDVQPGGTPSNGPLAPTVSPGLSQAPPDVPRSDGLLYQDFNAEDLDGYITRIDVDWGDGTKEVADFPLRECRDPVTRWPESKRKVRHGYTSPTDVSYRATVTSTGCDGLDLQHATNAGSMTGGTSPPAPP